MSETHTLRIGDQDYVVTVTTTTHINIVPVPAALPEPEPQPEPPVDIEPAPVDPPIVEPLPIVADAYVTVGKTPHAISHFRTGMQDVDNALRQGSEAARQRLGTVMHTMASHVMNFGAPDLWPKESDPKPTNWANLDARLKMFTAMDTEIALVGYNYPVWMRELVGAGGTVTPMPLDQPFSTSGRVMSSKYDKFDIYNYEIAKRYLAAPYNVRTLVYGNEYKGLYIRRDGKRGWDNAEYVTQYNRWVTQTERAAVDLGIDPKTLKLGGPYSAIRCERDPSGDTVPVGHPLRGRPYGEYRWHGLEAIEYWLKHAIRKDFVAWDMGSGNASGGEKVDTFVVQAQKYRDMAAWVRQLTDLPMVLTELYAKTADDDNADVERLAAAKMVAHLSLVEAGYSGAWLWGAIGQGEGSDPRNTNGGLLRDYSAGEPLPWYDAYRQVLAHFSEGANLYPVTVEGEGVYATATDHVVTVVNMTAAPRSVAVSGKLFVLEPFGVEVLLG